MRALDDQESNKYDNKIRKPLCLGVVKYSYGKCIAVFFIQCKTNLIMK